MMKGYTVGDENSSWDSDSNDSLISSSDSYNIVKECKKNENLSPLKPKKVVELDEPELKMIVDNMD